MRVARSCWWTRPWSPRILPPQIGKSDSFQVLWGADRSDVWTMGSTILHWNGSRWDTMASPASGHIYAVYGENKNSVWAGTLKGEVVHWDGASWSLHSSPGTVAIRGLAGAAPGRLWAIDELGMVSYWDGQVWATVRKNEMGIQQAWGNEKQVWAVGGMSAILGWPAQTAP